MRPNHHIHVRAAFFHHEPHRQQTAAHKESARGINKNSAPPHAALAHYNNTKVASTQRAALQLISRKYSNFYSHLSLYSLSTEEPACQRLTKKPKRNTSGRRQHAHTVKDH